MRVSTLFCPSTDKFFQSFIMLYLVVIGFGLHLQHFKLHATHIQECECIWFSKEHLLDLVRVQLLCFTFYDLLTILKSSMGYTILIVVSIYQMTLLLWCYKLYHSPKSPGSQITTWSLSKFEFTLFIIYSLAHSLLWLMVDDSNCWWGFVIMVVISWQVWNCNAQKLI